MFLTMDAVSDGPLFIAVVDGGVYCFERMASMFMSVFVCFCTYLLDLFACFAMTTAYISYIHDIYIL